jgi:hypothetical protein
MAVRLLALRAGRPLPPERFLALISVRGRFDPRAIMRLEELDKLKKSNYPVTMLYTSQRHGNLGESKISSGCKYVKYYVI